MAAQGTRAVRVPGISRRRPQERSLGRTRRSSRATRWALLAALFAALCSQWGGLPGRCASGIPSDEGADQEPHEHHEHHEHHEMSFRHEVGHLASHPVLFFSEILAVVVLSLLFETWEHWVHHRIEHAGDKTAEKILAAVFKELTCLGFIGLFLFGATRCGFVGACANLVRETDEHILLETFEAVHMIIFLLLLVLIFQAAAMLHVAHNVICDWSTFEHMRAYGKYKNSLESMFVDYGYLDRVPNGKAPRGTDLACKSRFVHGASFFERVKRRYDKVHSLVTWRFIRHEFIWPSNGKPSAVPSPALFSYSAYLRSRMTEVVLSLVELDKRVWVMTLMLPGPAVYFGTTMTYWNWQVSLCFFAWSLFCGAMLLTVALEEDLHGLMPPHSPPEDPRQLLVFFQGTSSSEMLQDVDNDDKLGAAIARGAPGFRSMRAFSPMANAKKPFMLSSGVCKEILRTLAFWQAIAITVLITTCVTRMPSAWYEIAVCLLTLAEWPLMLFWVVPVLIRRLTVRISNNVEPDLIRSITLDCKEALLRHHLRLVQFEGFYVRAAKEGQPWAQASGGASWTLLDAARTLKHGQHIFHWLPAAAQDEIGALFAILDINNDGRVYKKDFERFFSSMGFQDGGVAAEALIRLADWDGSGSLCEEGLQAVVALATVARPECELQEDVGTFFDMVDKERSGKVYCYQITQRLRAAKLSADLQDEDVASLLHTHFCQAKPTITKMEFIAWFQGMGNHWRHGHEGEQHGAHSH